MANIFLPHGPTALYIHHAPPYTSHKGADHLLFLRSIEIHEYRYVNVVLFIAAGYNNRVEHIKSGG